MRKSEKVMKLQKLVVSCGGTGGHFYPGLSIAGEFQKKYGEVLLLLSGAHAEEQSRIAENAGIRAVALPPMPHYRKNPFRFISGFLGGYFAAKRRLKEFSPQAMLGMGSFATLPVVLAAKSCRIPLFCMTVMPEWVKQTGNSVNGRSLPERHSRRSMRISAVVRSWKPVCRCGRNCWSLPGWIRGRRSRR